MVEKSLVWNRKLETLEKGLKSSLILQSNQKDENKKNLNTVLSYLSPYG